MNSFGAFRDFKNSTTNVNANVNAIPRQAGESAAKSTRRDGADIVFILYLAHTSITCAHGKFTNWFQLQSSNCSFDWLAESCDSARRSHLKTYALLRHFF